MKLPSGVSVSYPATAYAFLHQQVWITQGTLTLYQGATTYTLEQGDCLQLGLPEEACTFENATPVTCEYVIDLHHK